MFLLLLLLPLQFMMVIQSVSGQDEENTQNIKPKVHATIKGTIGDDRINGGDRHDKIYGEDGDDYLKGGKGDDKIDGGDGDDVLDGGEGADILIGGNGADVFICDLTDTITDFNSAEGDKIIGQCSVIDESLSESPSETESNGSTFSINVYTLYNTIFHNFLLM